MAANFKDKIADKAEWDEALKNKKIAVDFTASWCGPCKRIGPIFVEFAKDFPDILFFKVDVDDNAEVAELVGIEAMPTFKFYLDGKLVESLNITGANQETLKNNLKALADM